MRNLLLLILAAPALFASSHASVRYFEPVQSTTDTFSARGFGYSAELSAVSARMAVAGAKPLGWRLENTSAAAVLKGEGLLASRSHYLLGNDARKWRTNVPQFSRLRAHEIYPGSDVVYYAGPHGLEFDFVFNSSGNPSRVRLAFDRRIAVAADGAITDAATGERLLDAPRAYELDSAGKQYTVPSGFRVVASRVASFTVQRSDPRRTLVIDPTLIYATFLGGSGSDNIVSAARGPDGGLYVAGQTVSVDLPQAVSLNSILNRPIYLSATDDFVARYTPDGSALVYMVYVGGAQADLVKSLAVDPQGRATVAGFSYSYNFPTTPGAYQHDLGGRSYDAYCFRISADGSALEYSTFLGLVSLTYGYLPDPNQLKLLVGVDGLGTAIVAGTNATLGINATAGALQQTPPGALNGIVQRLNNSGTGLLYATWYGGNGTDRIEAMVVDAQGYAYLAGFTTSTNLPLAHSFQAAPPRGIQGTVTQMLPDFSPRSRPTAAP